jgi:hypothetical protein
MARNEAFDFLTKEMDEKTEPRGGVDWGKLTEEVESDDFDGRPPAWKPEAGDFLIGTVMNKFDATGEYGTHVALIVSQHETDQEFTVYCSPTVLAKQIDRANPMVGDAIAIKYLGTQKNPKNDREYKNFQAKVVRVGA